MPWMEVFNDETLIASFEVGPEEASSGVAFTPPGGPTLHPRIGQPSQIQGWYGCIKDAPSTEMPRFKSRTRDPFLPPLSTDGTDEAAREGMAPFRPRVPGFRLSEPLGRGGMGWVWRAKEESSDRTVALKVPRLDRGQTERFQQEIKLWGRLQHPNIVRLYGAGRCDVGDYLTMELIEGVPIDQYVSDRGLAEADIIRLLINICDALQYAHKQGVIHRDLKPSNILVADDGAPHVLDFGLAKGFLEEDLGESVSLDGQVVGTVDYMSPEQAAGKRARVDERTDVYALGVLAFRLLTGESPYESGLRSSQLREAIIAGEVRRPRQVSSTISSDLQSVLLKALAHDVGARYASPRSFAEDLRHVLSGEPVRARPLTTRYVMSKFVGRHKVALSGVAIAAALVVATVVWVGWTIAAERDHANQLAEERRQALYLQRIPVIANHLDRGEIEQAQALLEQCPQDLRHWEWHRLHHLANQNNLRVLGQWSRVEGLVFSHDGSEVGGVFDGQSMVFDAENGVRLKERDRVTPSKTTEDGPGKLTAEGESRGDRSIIWSPSSRQVQIIDTAQRRVIASLDGVVPPVRATELSVNGDRVVIADRNGLLIWSEARSQPLDDMLMAPPRTFWGLSVSPDGDQVAIGSIRGGSEFRTARTLSSRNGKSFGDGAAMMVAMDHVPDGRHLVAAAAEPAGMVVLVDVETGNEVSSWRLPEAIVGVACHPTQPLVALSSASKTWVVETSNGQIAQSFPGGGLSPAWSSAGKRIALTRRGQARREPVREEIVVFALDGESRVSLHGHDQQVTGIGFVGGDRLVSTGLDGRLRIWSISKRSALIDLPVAGGDGTYAQSLSLSPDGRRAVTAGGFVKLWDTATGAELMTLSEDTGSGHQALQVRFSRDGNLIAATGHGWVRTWRSSPR